MGIGLLLIHYSTKLAYYSMAKLNDFLGALSSSVCDARVNSDLQSLQIAKNYLSDDNPDKELLKHFSIPRMRIDKVEFNIPVGIEELNEKTTKIYQLADSAKFSEKTLQKVLDTLKVTSLSSTLRKKLNTAITDHVNLLEAKIKVSYTAHSLEEFSNSIATNTLDLAALIYKENGMRKPTRAQLTKLKIAIEKGLQSSLREDIIFKKEIKGLDNLQVIVEADRLREIKPENIITIKMTVSEQGMEWVNMEDKDGKIVNKLLPE